MNESRTLDPGEVVARLRAVGITCRPRMDIADHQVTVPTEGLPITLNRKRHHDRGAERHGSQGAWDSPWTIEHRGYTIPMRDGWVAKVKMAVAWEASMEAQRARVVREVGA